MNTLILYDTLYGHNFELGNFIHQTLLPSAIFLSFKEALQVKLDSINLLILCPCIYGEGQLTAPEEKFYNYLCQFSPIRLTYYIAGVGDKNFGPAKFANAVNIFDHQLRQHDASPLASSLKIDYEDLPVAQQTVTDEITNFLRKGRDSNH